MKTDRLDYTVEVDQVGREVWTDFLLQFEDANVYQTWSYGKIRWGEDKLSHLILKQGDRVVAMAQVRLLKVPLLKRGIAYIIWGPLWRRKQQPENTIHLRQVLETLAEEYSGQRKYLLRIANQCSREDQQAALEQFNTTGYSWPNRAKMKQTVLVDLTATLDDIRKSLHQKWRNCLNRSEKNDLEVAQGSGEPLYNEFMGLYETMLQRKNFDPGVDIKEFLKIQKDLPEQYKMQIYICREAGQPVAGVICSSANLGERGIYLLGATNDLALKNKASYLLQWKMIEYYKQAGCRWLDLGGINKVTNPGGYRFKTRISSKIVSYMGIFESCRSPLSALFVKAAEIMKLKK